MGEKWFQFVTRIKNETNAPSLKAAMKIASKRKSEWNKDGKGTGKVAPMNKTGKVAPMNKTGKGTGKGSRRNRGTRKNL